MLMDTKPILVLGAGAWGRALGRVLENNGIEVRLWDKASAHPSLETALSNVQDILVVVPSHAFASALGELKPLLTSSHRIIWATKGLEPGTACFLHEVVARELGNTRTCAVLSGPSFAKEVTLGLPTAVMVASRDPAFAAVVASQFRQDGFLVETSDDIIGVQLGGVVKNVLAVAVGLSDGVQFGANARAALMTRGLAEMMRLGVVLGARPETLMGLAGCGDIILTCTDNESRNRRFGLALAEGLTVTEAAKRVGQVVEAVYNVEQLCQLAKVCQVDLPIAEQVFRVIKHEIAPRDAIVELFKRVPAGK